MKVSDVIMIIEFQENLQHFVLNVLDSRNFVGFTYNPLKEKPQPLPEVQCQ